MAVEARVFEMGFRVLTVICEESFYIKHINVGNYTVSFLRASTSTSFPSEIRKCRSSVLLGTEVVCFLVLLLQVEIYGSQLKRKRPILEF